MKPANAARLSSPPMETNSESKSGRTELSTTANKIAEPHANRRPALVFLRGELLAVPIPLERSEVTLGRALDADVRINDSEASRLHARIRTEQDETTGQVRYRLIDLGSTNGTLLNGKPIDEAFLEDGDKFVIADHMLRLKCSTKIEDFSNRFIDCWFTTTHRLATSKSFFSELRREAARAEADNKPFCVLMMDLDHFKEVNDTYGHLAGSETLEEMGSVIKNSLRAGDVGARFGGEEFAAFLLDADYAQGMVAAERVRGAIEKHEFPAVRRGSTEEPRTHRMTISIGVASFPNDASDPIQLVEKADRNLRANEAAATSVR